MSKVLASDALLKVVAGLFLSLLVYQGKCLCDRVESLERNQIRIMVSLGIEPISWESLTSHGAQVPMAAGFAIQSNRNAEKSLDGP